MFGGAVFNLVCRVQDDRGLKYVNQRRGVSWVEKKSIRRLEARVRM